MEGGVRSVVLVRQPVFPVGGVHLGLFGVGGPLRGPGVGHGGGRKLRVFLWFQARFGCSPRVGGDMSEAMAPSCDGGGVSDVSVVVDSVLDAAQSGVVGERLREGLEVAVGDEAVESVGVAFDHGGCRGLGCESSDEAAGKA